MVRNTVTSSFKNDLEKAVLEAVSSEPDSERLEVAIVGFEIIPGIQIVVSGPRGLVAAWYFESFDSTATPEAIRRLASELGQDSGSGSSGAADDNGGREPR